MLCDGFSAAVQIVALVVVLTPGVAAQQHRQTLRGHVVADAGGFPISGADVVVTVPPERKLVTTTTDSAGRFELHIAQGTSDYLVHVDLIGWQPWRQRVRLAPGDSVATMDVRLSPKPIAVASVAANLTRPPSDLEDVLPKTGGAEQTVAGATAALAPVDASDLAAQAATLPGVRAVAGGFSVLGLPASQNNATLNGLTYEGGSLPRALSYLTQVATSVFDPSRGGFSGGQISVDLHGGGPYTERRGYLTLDAPALQANDPVAARSGQRFASFQGSLANTGELVFNRYYYSTAVQVNRTRADAVSISGAGGDVLQAAGLASDSAARFLGLLDSSGIPLGGVPDARTTTSASLLAQLDHTPRAQKSWSLTVLGNYSTTDPVLSPLTTASTGMGNTSYSVLLQGKHRTTFENRWLNTLRTGLTFGGSRSSPVLRLPSGSVLVASTLPDSSGGLTSLGFAGSGTSGTSSSSWTWETIDELQLYGNRSRHKIKLYAESRLDGFGRSRGMDYGYYSYASLADLAAERPASYTRALASPSAAGGEWSGALAIGDSWRTQRLALLFGARLEANQYTSAAPFNPAVLSGFGMRTDATPNHVHVSPRLGFSYSLEGSPLNRWGSRGTPVATRIVPLKGVLRGGIGEFRSLLPANLLAGPSMSTGLPGSSHRLYCVGSAVPVPDWGALAGGEAAPSACADGSDAFVDTAPAVSLIDPAYDAARSWRVNLGWSGLIGSFGLTVDGFYSLNLNQPGLVDLNFSGTPRFTVGDEGRPVFVEASAIVPSTGAVSPLEARRHTAFGAVLSRRSDLRGSSRQLTVTLSPWETGLKTGRSGGYFGTLAYTLADARLQTRGFAGGAFGDPSVRVTAPAPLDIRHTITLQAGWYRGRFSTSLYGRLFSGAPFTPIVNGDVNGDGVGGDRAYVYDPAHTADPALAAGMRSLLVTSAGRVRNCLEGQLGRAAGVNSCRGPWTATMNSEFRYEFSKRGVLTVNLSNPLGGLDQLLHGARHLRGWGTAAYPDPVLYAVRGFDPASQRFLYEVNPRFGSTSPSTTVARAPLRLTLDVRLDLGRPLSIQQIERSVVIAHRMPAPALRQRLSGSIPDVYRTILQMSDSLLLSTEQTEELEEGHSRYRTRLDPLWAELADYIASLANGFDKSVAIARQHATEERGWAITEGDMPVIRSILSPLQQMLLPPLTIRLIKGERIGIGY